jgi:Zn-dependent alcohol dehydrogenase
MKAKAAVAWEQKKSLSIEEVEVMGPKEGEVLLKVIASGVCHTQNYVSSVDCYPKLQGRHQWHLDRSRCHFCR